MSNATEVQRAVKRKAPPSTTEGTDFSLAAPGSAIASTFRNASTNFPPSFAEVPFQSTQVPIPNQSLPNQSPVPPASMDTSESELSQILGSLAGSQKQNGDDILQRLLTNPSKTSCEEIMYYDSGAGESHVISASHHTVSGDVTVSNGAGQYLGTGDQQNGTEIMEILSQFS
jgi:hypothetical protein